jgi:hypothetical protein
LADLDPRCTAKLEFTEWHLGLGAFYRVYNPVFSALLITLLVSNKSGLKELYSRVFHWQIGFIRLLISLLQHGPESFSERT